MRLSKGKKEVWFWFSEVIVVKKIICDKMTDLQESAPIIITLCVLRLASLQDAAFSA